MTTSDAVFLAEVEEFLSSCEIPMFPTFQTSRTLQESGNLANDPLLATTSSTCLERVHVAASEIHLNSRKTRTAPDDAAKRELEKAKDRKRRKAYRERRRIERDNLQQQESHLSAELAKRDADKTSMASVWRVIAESQIQARLNAEAEQRQLLAAIDARTTMIRGLKEFVHGRIAKEVELVDDTLAKQSSQRKRVRLEPSDAEFYEAYVDELDSIFAKTDDILRACGLDSTEVDWSDSKQKWREGVGTGYFMYEDKHVMPFDFQQTCESLWYMAQMPHRQEDRRTYNQLDEPENTAAYKFRVTTPLQSGRVASIQQRTVSRRYKQKGCEVIVWRSFSEGEGMFTDMHADETGWLVVTPLEGISVAKATLVRTYIRNIPMHLSRVATHDLDVTQFTGVVFDAAKQDGVELASGLEKLLFED